MKLFFWVLFTFLCGSFPTAYFTARVLRGIDIRRYGSGNSGATNAFRVLGKGPGTFVFAVDFLKGTFPVALYSIFGAAPDGFAVPEIAVWVGFAGMLGHIFTPFLGFRGGKGIATGAGVLCGSFPHIFLIVIAVWILVFCLTRIVSISSLLALVALVLASAWLKVPASVLGLFILVLLLGIWTHRLNILRLLKAEEDKLRK